MTTRADFAAALTWLRERAGLTVRDVARRLNTPAGTLGDYFSGRHIPSAAQLPVLRLLLAECGVAEPADAEAWVAAWRRARKASDRRIARPAVPYRGLGPFEPEDAALFFGRTAERDALLDRIAQLRVTPGPSHGLLVVIGSSGSGKSSLLRAGVVAALRASDPAGCALVTPRERPAAALSAGDRVVVIDQFEELFTGAADTAARAELLAALTERDPRVPVVLGLRADFYAAAMREPTLLAALQHGQFVIGPMRPEQVREVIVGPAKHVGATVEAGLVELVLADLTPHGRHYDAGALPLLSHALLCTWERAQGGRLTVADYRAAGGLEGAVQRSAEEVFGALSPAQQDVARRLFVRLVSIDESTVTRRYVSWDELDRFDDETPEVVNRFVAGRLLTADTDSVSISHERLLSAWPRLQDWIDADRAGLRLRRRVTEAANGWQEAGRDPELLLRGVRLEAAAEFAGDPLHARALNRLERDFVDAGVAQASRERLRERRRARRLSRLLATVAVLAVAAIMLAGYSFQARAQANHERTNANSARDDALSRQVAFQARALQTSDPALAQQLALVAYRIAPTDTARSALVDESAEPTITRLLGAQGPTALALAANGALIAVGHADDGSVHLYRPSATGPPQPAGVIHGAGDGHGQVFALAFAPGGRELAAGGVGGHVHLWNIADPAHPTSIAVLQPAMSGAVECISFSPSGHIVVAGSAGPNPLQRWDVTDPAHPQRLGAPRGEPAAITVQAVAFSPDGRTLAAGGSDGAVRSWPAASAATTAPRVASTAHAATIDALAYTPDGALLLAGDRAGVVTAWSTGAGLPVAVHTLPGATNSQVNTLAISPDGSQLAVGSSDNTVRQWNTTTWTEVATTEHPGPVTGIAYSADGSTLLSAAADGTLRLWPAHGRLVPIGTGSAFTVTFAGTRLAVATNGSGGAVQLWTLGDADRPQRLGAPLRMADGAAPVDGAAALRPDGRLVAAGNARGTVQLWNLDDPEHARPAGPAFAAAGALIESLAFSPDGHTLAVGADDNSVHLWDVSDPARPRSLATMPTGNLALDVTFDNTGGLLAAASADNHAYLWDVHDRAHPREVARLGGFASYVYSVAFSPDGRILAAGSADHTTRLWDVTRPGNPAPLGNPLTGPADYVLGLAFNPAGTKLAVASNDRTVWIYDVHDPRHATTDETLRALAGNVNAIAFSPDGKTLVAGGRYPSLALWTVDPDADAAQLCAHAGDPITRAEWAQYVPGAQYAPPCTGH